MGDATVDVDVVARLGLNGLLTAHEFDGALEDVTSFVHVGMDVHGYADACGDVVNENRGGLAIPKELFFLSDNVDKVSLPCGDI